MAKEIIKQGNSLFEQIKQIDENGNEFWYARQLAKVLEYTDFRNFTGVIKKAKEACVNSGQEVSNHSVEANEMVSIGSGAEREMPSFKFSRYFCYLIVQNADPSKAVVAFGQTYFAVQTRIQEIQGLEAYQQLSTEEEKRLFLRNEMAKHNTQLAAAAKDAGVIAPLDYATFQNHGYKGLYGGLDAKGIKHKIRHKEKPADTRPYRQYRISSQSFPCYANRRKTNTGANKRQTESQPNPL